MNLADALGDWPSDGNNPSAGGAVWPGQPGPQPQWPGGPPAGQPGHQPQWPGGPPAGQPGPQPQWPGGPPAGQPGHQPQWPGGPPAGQPGHQPQWPGGPPAGGAPNQPAWPTQPGQPSAPGGWPSPSPGPGPGPAPHAPTAPQKSVSMPYNQQLPHGAFDKLLITIIGTVKPNANKFTVDLSASHDLAFHFNPRFNEEGKQAIVRNSMINKKWGREERELGHFPFARGQPFELKIMCTNSEFKVAVNKTHLLEYKHRVRDLKSINRLSINYDVNLSSVQIDRLP